MSVQFPEEFNLADYYLFDRLGEGLGDKVAIRYGALDYTYNDVADRTRALARYFQSVGVQREQRIYTVLKDAPPFSWSFFATLAHGATVAMGNPVAPTDDLGYVVDYSRCAVLVTSGPRCRRSDRGRGGWERCNVLSCMARGTRALRRDTRDPCATQSRYSFSPSRLAPPQRQEP